MQLLNGVFHIEDEKTFTDIINKSLNSCLYA